MVMRRVSDHCTGNWRSQIYREHQKRRPRSLSDLGAVWPHNVVWLGGWCTRCSGGNEQFSRGGSGDGVSAAALGERVASRAASGAGFGGGGRKVRPERDEGRLSWVGVGA